MSILCKTTRAIRNFADKTHKWVYKNYELPRLVRAYVPGVTRPWSASYIAARNDFITRQILSPDLMQRFSHTKAQPALLPRGYGTGFDERCVEWPWAIAGIGDAKRILDAGSALNHWHILQLPLWEDKKLDIYTLHPEAHFTPAGNISYLFGDLRQTPYKDGEFDLVISISTLEHVGMDNSAYSGQARHREQDFDALFLVLREIKRILKPGGAFLWSVPFGTYEAHGAFRQFDAALLERCKTYFTPTHQQDVFFLYTAQGWQRACREDCTQAAYACDSYNAKNFKIQPDLAVASRAVALCRWQA